MLQHQQHESDEKLLQLLLDNDGIPVPVLLEWIDAYRGPGPPSPFSHPTAIETVKTTHSPCAVSSYNNFDAWREKLVAASPQSFAVIFLNHVRAEVQPFLGLADCAVDMITNTVPPSQKNEQAQVLLKGTKDFVNLDPFGGLNTNYTRKPKPGASSADQIAAQNGAKQKEKGKLGGVTQSSAAPRCMDLPAYEDNFPALGRGVLTKNIPSQSKQKRRVTPTPTANPTVDSAFILAKVEVNALPNKSSFPGGGPLKVDMDTLMQRFGKTNKQKQKETSQALSKDSSGPWTSNEPDCGPASKGSSQQLSVHQKLADLEGTRGEIFDGTSNSTNIKGIVSPEQSTKVQVPVAVNIQRDSVGPAITERAESKWGDECFKSAAHGNFPHRPLFKKLTRMATVHATLLLAKLVPSLLKELHLLLQLLSLEPENAGDGSGHTIRGAAPVAEVVQDKDNLFSSGYDCAGYACAVLEQAGHILDCVGEHLLMALIEEPAIAHHSPSLLVRLKASLADHQAAALHSFKAYEATISSNGAFEQSPNGGSLRLNSWTLPGVPVFLPFHAARDSRNIFKTPEEQRAYNNREHCRDHFYSIMRKAASTTTAFGWASSGSEDEGYRMMKEAVRQFLQVLLVENYPWFAELFLEQVLQVSSCGETDPEVTSLVKQDPAKLQRLHDRLTSTTSTRLTTGTQKQVVNSSDNGESRLALAPSSPWSQVKTMDQRTKSQELRSMNDFSTGNAQVLNKARSASFAKDKSMVQVDSWSRFSGFFPQALRIYIWFLEAADSHRLSMQMIWSIKGKIHILTELPPHSRDSADIGSGFTQRVLALKALAGMLGYLFVSPGAGARPPAPGPEIHSGPTNTMWDTTRSEPPINVVSILGKARMQGSLLLNLPWILEFLRLLKADWQALHHPHIQTIISGLRDVYLVPILDPSNPHFGVGSICILASLDGFFEYMELSPCSANEWLKKGRCSQWDTSKTKEDTDARGVEPLAGDAVFAEGLDTMLGIVDARYIQHCCPLLMEMRGVLVEGKKCRQRQREPNWPASPGLQRTRFIRKITPVQNPGPSVSWDISSSMMAGENSALNNLSSSTEDHLKWKLQRSFLEQRPHLRRIVDFVVDTVAGNAARAAVLNVVPPVLHNALENLQVVLSSTSREVAGAPNARDTELEQFRTGQVETAAEHIITATIHQALGPALEFAKLYATERTAEALHALVDPQESSFVLGVAAGIAAETAGLAASQKALASVSGEIRKRVIDDLEIWHRKMHIQQMNGDSESSQSVGKFESQAEPLQQSCQQISSFMASPAARGQSGPSSTNPQLFSEGPAPLFPLGISEPPTGSIGEFLSEAVSIIGAHESVVPEQKVLSSNVDRQEVSPQHVIVKDGSYTVMSETSSSEKVVKHITAAKRQLSFSLRGRTFTGDKDTLGKQPALGHAVDHVATVQEKVVCRPEEPGSGGDEPVIISPEELPINACQQRQRNESPCLEDLSMERQRKVPIVPGREVFCEQETGFMSQLQERLTDYFRAIASNGEYELPALDHPSQIEPKERTVDRHSSMIGKQELSGSMSLTNRLTEACAKAYDCCSRDPFVDANRHLLRHHLAAICFSMEGLLLQITGVAPPGGFDAFVFEPDSRSQNLRVDGGQEVSMSASGEVSSNLQSNAEASLNSGQLYKSLTLKVVGGEWRVESGLTRRTLALALQLALLSPTMFFGLCYACMSYISAPFEQESTGRSTASEGINLEYTNSTIQKSTGLKSEDCSRCNGGALVNALVLLWRGLVKCQIFPATFLVRELLASWRWMLALRCQPWQVNSSSWSMMVQGGMAFILVELMEAGGETCLQGMEALLCMFLMRMSGRGDDTGNSGMGPASLLTGGESFAASNNVSVRIQTPLVRKRDSRNDIDETSSAHEAQKLALGMAVYVLQHYCKSESDLFQLGVYPGKLHTESPKVSFNSLQIMVDTCCQQRIQHNGPMLLSSGLGGYEEAHLHPGQHLSSILKVISKVSKGECQHWMMALIDSIDLWYFHAGQVTHEVQQQVRKISGSEIVIDGVQTAAPDVIQQ